MVYNLSFCVSYFKCYRASIPMQLAVTQALTSSIITSWKFRWKFFKEPFFTLQGNRRKYVFFALIARKWAFKKVSTIIESDSIAFFKVCTDSSPMWTKCGLYLEKKSNKKIATNKHQLFWLFYCHEISINRFNCCWVSCKIWF